MAWGNVTLTLKNPRLPGLQPVAVEALADANAWPLHIIPKPVWVQLPLEINDSREVALADETRTWVPYVGPIEARFKNRVGYTGALVMRDRVVLGSVPMAHTDLVILSATPTVEADSDSPGLGTLRAR